ncbi:cell division protein ZapD [Natronospira proteinivora]|uniref:Cell division protein ZapD n=1 Tax=Natronospira proteinivora TaxID=1807133 RepID=A0ABT1G497_9GAMM|nr:cell division protein ZapD [Natronospira proteinivora]MCP1726118.1 cell division protein ZapD [Natronospira proteinivora]
MSSHAIVNGPAAARVTYEQPFNEQIRTFLRLEHLFRRARHAVSRQSAWDSLSGAETVLEILALMGRGDVRRALLKETDRLCQALRDYSHHEGVDKKRLNGVLDQLAIVREGLSAGQMSPDRPLRENDFLAMIQQRLSIPGGTCGFDLPRLHAWLEQSAEDRKPDVEAWLEQLSPIEAAVKEVLKLIRGSAQEEPCTAIRGFYRSNLGGEPNCRMVRVTIAQPGLYPEISGNRHRFTVRFLNLGDLAGQADPVSDDVHFGLALCQL